MKKTFGRAGLVAALATAALVAGGASAVGAARPAPPTRAVWQHDVAGHGRLAPGCYETLYPSTSWHATACTAAPDTAYAPATGPGRPGHVGDGYDYSAVLSGGIAGSTGTFGGVTAATTERGILRSGGPLVANTYSLQMNSQFFAHSPACAAAATPKRCLGWEQFIYDSHYNGVFMQYWLIDYSTKAKPACPAGWYTYRPDCYRNSEAIRLTGHRVTAAELGDISLTGTATLGGNDSVTLVDPSGVAYTAVGPDTVVGLADFWTTSEFNVFGDGGGSEAHFGPGTNIEPMQTLTGKGALGCTVAGYTAETSNLNLNQTPVLGPEAKPTIAFDQTNGFHARPTCATAA